MTSLYDWSYWFCEAWLVPLITPLLYFTITERQPRFTQVQVFHFMTGALELGP